MHLFKVTIFATKPRSKHVTHEVTYNLIARDDSAARRRALAKWRTLYKGWAKADIPNFRFCEIEYRSDIDD